VCCISVLLLDTVILVHVVQNKEMIHLVNDLHYIKKRNNNKKTCFL